MAAGDAQQGPGLRPIHPPKRLPRPPSAPATAATACRPLPGIQKPFRGRNRSAFLLGEDLVQVWRPRATCGASRASQGFRLDARKGEVEQQWLARRQVLYKALCAYCNASASFCSLAMFSPMNGPCLAGNIPKLGGKGRQEVLERS